MYDSIGPSTKGEIGQEVTKHYWPLVQGLFVWFQRVDNAPADPRTQAVPLSNGPNDGVQHSSRQLFKSRQAAPSDAPGSKTYAPR